VQNAKLAILLIAAVLVVAGAADAMLAQSTQPSPSAHARREVTLWSTIKAGRMIGLLIILMSMAAGALVVEHYLSIRQERILPASLEKALDEHLAGERYGVAAELCRKDDSFLAKIVEAGLSQRGGMFGFFDMQNAMQEVAEREVSKLHRKLEYLSFIAAAAPMLGLLGTVTGMIRSFNKIAATEGAAQPSDLAGGISEALVTTCMGLIVAIPTMFFVSQFRSRIDRYVAEAETIVERLMGRFRRRAN